MLSVVVLSHVVNDGVHRECLLLTLIVSFSFSLELLFTFYFYFQNCFLLYFFSFTYVLFLVSTRTSNPPHLPPFVRGALFFLCHGTNIYNSFWGVPEFQGMYHGFIYFLTFSIFLKWILILLVREKHRKTLYRFLLAKIKDGVRTTGIKTLNTTNR